MLSFVPIHLFEYSTCPQFCCTRTCLLRHRNWSCSVAFLKMWTSDCYSLRKPLTLSVTFYVPLNGVFRSAYNHMPCVHLLFTQNNLNLPNQSSYFHSPYICPYHSEISPWLAGGYRNPLPYLDWNVSAFIVRTLQWWASLQILIINKYGSL